MPLLEVHDGRQKLFAAIEAQPGQKLSQAIWLSGQLPPLPLCNGLGLCGNCRCRFMDAPPPPADTDLALFTQDELELGWRLACRQTMPDAALRIQLPQQAFIRYDASRLAATPAAGAPVYLGVDLGTTSIQWQAVSREGEKLIGGAMPNPQAAAGADIISRLQYAAENPGDILARLAKESFAAIIKTINAQNFPVTKMCVAANSALTEILLARDISGLTAAPYKLSYEGNQWLNLRLPGLDKPVSAYIPPLIAPFVGGDISAGLAALLNAPRPFLLADLGTNAEFALLDSQNRLFIVSAPLGPALEGIGPANGQCAAPGVITGFDLAPTGLEARFFADQPSAQPPGISATGYLSLLALLLKLGLMTEQGQLKASGSMPLARKLAAGIDNGILNLAAGLKLTHADIELLLKVKATFTVALQRLLQTARLTAADLRAFYLAGALGEYAEMADLETLGFLPPALAGKTVKAGNTSLAGACLLSRSQVTADKLSPLCAHALCLQLADENDFMDNYISAMHWGNYGS